MDFLNKHLWKAEARHANNRALLTAIINCHYVFDKYYKLIDETAIYTAAILLHPQRRLNYLNKVWEKSWIKLGVTRVRKLFETHHKDKYLPPSQD